MPQMCHSPQFTTQGIELQKAQGGQAGIPAQSWLMQLHWTPCCFSSKAERRLSKVKRRPPGVERGAMRKQQRLCIAEAFKHSLPLQENKHCSLRDWPSKPRWKTSRRAGSTALKKPTTNQLILAGGEEERLERPCWVGDNSTLTRGVLRRKGGHQFTFCLQCLLPTRSVVIITIATHQ